MTGVLAIEYSLPEKIITNEELAELYVNWTAEKIEKKTGIKTRHVTKEAETAADLGVIAAQKLIERNIVPKENIDFVICVTQSPDYKLPTTACMVQDRLRLPLKTGAFDINLGCSGYIYGLAAAKSLVETGVANNVLLITAETYTKHINPLDKSTRTIFGDGAAATLIGHGGMEIGGFDLGTDGSGKDFLIIPAGGARKPCTPETALEKEIDGNVRSEDNLYMSGADIFEFTIREVPASVKRILKKENLRKDAVDLFVFHQANLFMLDFLVKLMKVDKEKFYMNFADTGNTVSASIPIALKRALDEGAIKPNQTIVLCGFGVGLSWGSTVIRTGNVAL
ncbi:3-oxoacyl-[acyl-carrier-protein] synthase-3 [Succiniclasticum ruminis]|uniref:3-oxoacyl-[acyl-carrier-protein] synthase-3 n=1 Tax=Succiniclasticum ruminis TaxID=40841 RepID=A0A1G6HRC9_9FIRM|nr:ketoacyl-ACP synthase III [Succiniclasticum ruminis]SDB96782.1 3-oxoacyl-[acyl-carrier-protein] synthase-3 [Succiniclasticum ruminis]